MMTSAETMRRAVAAQRSGDSGAAIKLAQAAHVADPRNAAILQFIGVVHCQSGDFAGGMQWLRRALTLNPQDPSLRFNTAKAALDSGDAALAQSLCEPIARTPQGGRLLAEALKAAGDAEGAAAQYERLARQFPNDNQILNNFGNALILANRAADAVAPLAAAARLDPRSAQIQLNLGRAHAATFDFDSALAAFRRAAELQPEDPAVHFELGKSLLRHGQYPEAILQLADAARLGERSAELFVLMGVAFSATEKLEEAEQAYRTAIATDRSQARAHANLAILLEHGNRIDELQQVAAAARAALPAGADLDYIEALIAFRERRFADALRLAEHAPEETIEPAMRNHFIGQVADRLGDVERAYACFSEMNRRMSVAPEGAAFDGTEQRAIIRATTDVVTPEWYARWRPVPIPDSRPSPAFLAGFLRSGTTLLDTILMGHRGTEVREEQPMIAELEEAAGPMPGLDSVGADTVARMRDAYFAEARRLGPLPDGKLLIDKYPLATLRTSIIHRAFPDARFIFALRHPCDVVLSCWMQRFRASRAMASFFTLRNAAGMYDATMAHWMRCRDVMPLSVHTVRYEDMVDDLEGTLRPLIDFLDLEWDDALLDHQKTARGRGFIRTPSYAQVTERVYKRSSGRWLAYRHHFGDEALALLDPWAVRFGYGSVFDAD